MGKGHYCMYYYYYIVIVTYFLRNRRRQRVHRFPSQCWNTIASCCRRKDPFPRPFGKCWLWMNPCWIHCKEKLVRLHSRKNALSWSVTSRNESHYSREEKPVNETKTLYLLPWEFARWNWTFFFSLEGTDKYLKQGWTFWQVIGLYRSPRTSEIESTISLPSLWCYYHTW